MKLNELKQALPTLMKHRIVPFVWGSQGLGKTQTVKQVAHSLGKDFGFVHLHLATQEVGDLVGLLTHSKDRNSVHHAKPTWYPTEGRGILFLDELNRAHPDVLQAMFSLITERSIHTHKLPEGWSIVAAGNYQSNQFNVTDTSDAAWMSRFCHIDFMPGVEEFTAFAESRDAFSVANFIRDHAEMVEVKPKERLNLDLIMPNRRAYLEMIAPLEAEEGIENLRYELYCGIIGRTATAAFLAHKKTASKRISGKQVLKEYTKVRDRVLDSSGEKETRFDLLSGALDEILLYIPGKTLSTSEMDNFKAFLLDIPLELGLKAANSLLTVSWVQRYQILNDVTFVDAFKAKRTEKSRKK